jgi:PAS domain S-box-containing protein
MNSDSSLPFFEISCVLIVLLLAYILYIHYAQRGKVRRQIQMQKMVVGISTRLLNLSLSKFDAEILNVLSEVGTFLDVDRCLLSVFDDGRLVLDKFYRWSAEGYGPTECIDQGISLEPYQSLTAKLKNNEVVNIYDVNEPDIDGEAEKQLWQHLGLASVLFIPLTLDNELFGFFGFNSIRRKKRWTEEDVRLLSLIGEIFTNALSRKRIEETIGKNEERFRTVYENAPIMLGIFNAKNECLLWNHELEKNLGVSQADIGFINSIFSMPAIGAEFLSSQIADIQEKNGAFREYRIFAYDGRARTQMWAYYTLGDGTHIGIGVDISDLKDAEEALRISEMRYKTIADENERLLKKAREDAKIKTELLSEVNHRVKNNLSAIIGLLYTEQRFADREDQASARRILKDIAGRIEGLAIAHNLLSISSWAPIKLEVMIHQIIAAALKSIPADKRVEIYVAPSKVLIQPNQTTSLALIVNELITNSLKYALDGRYLARITVTITEKRNVCEIHYQDDGPGYPEDVLTFRRHNVGLYLIQTITQHDLRGEVTLENNQGAVTNIKFKL